MEFDVLSYAVIGSSFLIAGFVKGVVGLGLPTISLALLTLLLDLPTAMALLVVPAFSTNLWQGFIGGHLALLSRRLWPLFLAVIPFVWLGTRMFDLFEIAILTRILGCMVVIYAALSFLSLPYTLSLPLQVWLGPLCGAINGVLTGLTGSLFLPGVMYLHAIGLTRDQLVQAMGLLFAVSTLALGISLQETGRIDAGLWQISSFALLPALFGMHCGKFFRDYLSDDFFHRVFLSGLALIGLHIMLG
jgi:uncharacterized membrane protein YfcA